jgi:hypothetical protein
MLSGLMTPRRLLLLLAATGVLAAGGLRFWSSEAPASTPLPLADAPPAAGPRFDAAQIVTGRLPMERMPTEIGDALELQSEEIVKSAQALEGKQARITGTCAPGSAIRVIAENGTVSCQHLPRGVVSVPSLTAMPLVTGTPTAAANVRGGVGRYQTGGEDDFLVAPVVLPDGAIVTGFTYVFFDSAPDIDGSAYLYRSDGQQMAEVGTQGAANEVRMTTTDRIEAKKVDATRYAYVVYFQTSTRAGTSLVPISASVTYRLP